MTAVTGMLTALWLSITQRVLLSTHASMQASEQVVNSSNRETLYVSILHHLYQKLHSRLLYGFEHVTNPLYSFLSPALMLRLEAVQICWSTNQQPTNACMNLTPPFFSSLFEAIANLEWTTLSGPAVSAVLPSRHWH